MWSLGRGESQMGVVTISIWEGAYMMYLGPSQTCKIGLFENIDNGF